MRTPGRYPPGWWLLLITLSFATPARAVDSPVVRLATTTSTENSGLLQRLLPLFEQQTGYKVHVIAVGTGKALRLGRDGDVDAVLVHSPAAERAFVEAGYGVNRRDVMYNDFVLVGPPHDPAGVRGLADTAVTLTRIAGAGAAFVSRGDDSGTHKKELELWTAAGVKPSAPWYRSVGQGMGKVLLMAHEFGAYALVDRGTWLAMKDKLRLDVLAQGDTRLFNPYGIIAVNPARYPDVNRAGAQALIDWITSAPARALIAGFRIHGEALFVPVTVQAQTETRAR